MTGWTLEITPHRGLFHLPVREIWQYRDLLWMLVLRDLVTFYKQTVLGPIWFLLQPVLTMLIYLLVFGNIAQIPTDGLPPALFYLAGIVMWNYFADSFARSSITFVMNADIFGKVYFPRLLIPLSLVISGLLKFLIQFGLFLGLLAWYLARTDQLHPNRWILCVPALVLCIATLGFAFGLIFSALTSKYRDLNFVIQFGIELLKFATPVIYPMSLLSPRLQNVLWWNPLAPLIEAFRYAFLGEGQFRLDGLVYSGGFTVLVLTLGVILFHHVERTFMDTV